MRSRSRPNIALDRSVSLQRNLRLVLGSAIALGGFVVGFDSEEVGFQSAGAALSGTIVFPKESPPAAAMDGHFWETHSHEEVAAYMKSVRYRSDDVDPRTSLSKLAIPAFWVFRGQDNIIPVDLSVVRLEELIAHGQSQFRYKIYPEYRHELMILFESSKLSLSRPFPEVAGWIRNTIG